MSLLENRDELSDQDILDAIDELVLAEGRELRLSLRAKEEFRRELFCSVRKLDVIQELVDDPSVTEIMVNGYRNIFVEKSGKIRKWEKDFSSEERLWDVIQQIAGRCNRVVNEETPILRLPLHTVGTAHHAQPGTANQCLRQENDAIPYAGCLLNFRTANTAIRPF